MAKKNKFETNAIHVGNKPDPSTGSVSPPINLTSTFAQDGIGKNKGFDYSRGTNPTRERLEKNIASLEGGYDAIAFSSGMAATTALFQSLKKGDHVIISRNVYGGTYRMTTQILRNHGLKQNGSLLKLQLIPCLRSQISKRFLKYARITI